MKVEFETHGYFLEFRIRQRYIGSLKLDKPDRKTVGYFGRKQYILEEDVYLDNKKKIKKGTEVDTWMYPICGRIKGDMKHRLDVLYNSRVGYQIEK